MPGRLTLGISSRTQLTIMVSLGMARNVMNLFSFTWTGNVQKIWDLPGPEPSFTAKYHFDYWLKNVLSLVVLFRNFTTHLHLVLYIVMLYPLLTGERPRLMVPWLYLQMLKNIVTDVICTVVGVLLCWTLHSCGLMLLEFLIVRVISMMPSIYLWRQLRSYHFDLYYAELDADYSYPMVKANHLTLAQRRRASKSIDGTVISTVRSSDSRPRIISCLNYDEIFGPPNWEEDEHQVTKSLTTLLTMESEELDDDSLTPAEKTLRILGLTRDQLHKITSTTDVADQEPPDVDLRSSLFSVAEESLGLRTVGMQVRLAVGSKTRTADVSGERRTQCTCCEGTKCSKEEESDSEEEDEAKRAADTSSERKSVDCCDKTRDRKIKLDEPEDSDKKERDDNNAREPEAQVISVQCEHDSETISHPSGCQEDQLHPGYSLQAVLQRDEIPWENLKEINFVSVINKALCNDQKPKVEDSEVTRPEWQSEQKSPEIIPEREDGTQFISRPQTSWDFDGLAFSVPTSASFGVDSDILALNASRDFEKTLISGNRSFDSTALIRPDHDVSDQSYFESSFQRHANMFDDSRAKLEPLGILQHEVDSSTYRVANKISVNYDPWDFDTDKFSTSEDAVLKPSRDSEVTLKSQRIISGEKYLPGGTKDRRSLASSSRSSRIRETAEEREAKTMQALKAYNEMTLLRYKREMDEFRHPLSERNRATSFSQDSVPGLENPEKELILNIENAYARFTRSKRPDSTFDVVAENRSTKEFFEIYSGVAGREKKYCDENKKGTRKQHSKYSESLGGVKRNESDVTSMSCKIIEGLQKGRELDRTVAMENIAVEHNVQQVYFFDQQVNDRPSTSKNQPIITIKPFSRQLNDDNVLGTVSSEVLTSMIEVLNNPEEIPLRIEDTEYYRQLRKNNRPKNIKDVVNNIDWSFRRPPHVDRCSNFVTTNTGAEVARAEANPRQDIVEKTTEKLLEIAFANSENSERGFHLGESEGEFYPIFNTFALAIEEIVRAAGRRGYTDEFTSQPATEVEIAETDFYGLAGCSSLRCLLTGDIRALKKQGREKKEEPIAVTTSTAPGSPSKKLDPPAIRREDSLDRDETVSIHADEEGTSVLRKFIASEESESAEINVPVIGPEDIPEGSEDAKKVQRADVASCRRILERFDTGGTELRGMIAEVFEHFDSSGEISFPNCSLRGSDLIAGLQIVSNLYEIRNTAGEIMSAEGETSSKDTGNSSLQDNKQSESRSTSGATNFENVSVNTPTGSDNPRSFGRGKGDRDNEENNLNRRGIKSYLDSESPSRDKIGEPKKLLSSILDADFVSPTHSEVLRRNDFRRRVINSGFVQAVQQGSDACEKDARVQNESFEESEDEMSKLLDTDDEHDDATVLVDFASNATSDAVLREIEIADDAIKRMKSVFEQFSKEQEQNRTESLKLDSKVSFLTNLRFPVDGELRKLQNLVQIVANFTTITGSTSAQSIKLDRRKSSGVFQNVSNDCPTVAVTVPKSIGVLNNPAGSRDDMESFSSWDKIIPPSTRRQLAKDRRKSKLRKTLADREPPRRVVKVIRMIEKKESEFFSARSIPQRGRGLSSGYLMDSDSDGNFTVSRPPTPASIGSATSQNEEPKFDSPISQVPDRPVQTCLSSSSKIHIQGMKVDHQCAQNALRDPDLDVISTTGNYLENMKSVDAAGIENNLKDVAQLVLSHQFRELEPSTVEVPTASKNTSLTTILVATRADLRSTSSNPEVDVEQDCELRVREKLSKAEDTTVEQLAAHCRDSDSKSENSDAVPFDVARKESRDVGIGTECDTEDFEENEMISVINLNSSLSSESYQYKPEEGVEVPNRFTMTSSYDSFISLFSQKNLVDLTQQSPQVTFISNHSHFEEFTEQVVNSFQSLGTACIADKESTESRLQEEDFEEEFRRESSHNNTLTSTPGTSRVHANSEKNSKSKKKGIYRG